MMIKTLKKELSVALEVQATAEKREAPEKDGAAKVDMDAGKSESLEERVKELEAELSEAQEVIAEFKASWEADRKVIAVLSKMKDAPEAQAKIAAAAAEESSSSSVFSKWAAGVTRVLVGEPAADVAAEKLKASAIKWLKYDAIEAEKAKAEKAKPYARQGQRHHRHAPRQEGDRGACRRRERKRDRPTGSRLPSRRRRLRRRLRRRRRRSRSLSR